MLVFLLDAIKLLEPAISNAEILRVQRRPAAPYCIEETQGLIKA